MNVFDTRWLGRHGIGRFAAELYARVAGFGALPPGGSPAAPFDPWVLRARLRELGAKFFLSPGYNGPASPCCEFAFCLHDLNHLQVPENSSPLHRAYFRAVIRPAVRRAAVVLTVSEFSREAICDWADVSADSVVNVSNGVSDCFRSDGARANLGRPYFLHVGNHKPHKNVRRLLSAFRRSSLQTRMDLVMTGAPSLALSRHIKDLGLEATVKFAGSLADEELARLYRGARALVFPSLYEGFGLPIVEAMRCGTPVLTSNAAAMPEAAGGAALLIDPLDEDALIQAMRWLAADEDLLARLRRRGLEHASGFSWSAVAKRVERALGSRIGWSRGQRCASL